MNIIQKLQRRYATKKFDASKKISDNDLETLIDALVLTPSSFGLQWWKFLAIEDKTARKQLVEHSWGQEQVVDAPVLFVLCREKDFWQDNIDKYINDIAQKRDVTTESLAWFKAMMEWFVANMSPDQQKTWLNKQLYIALWFLLETAALLEIDTCPMEWFIAEKYSEILELDQQWLVPVVVCPAWYRSEEDRTKDWKKIRYNKDEVVIRM